MPYNKEKLAAQHKVWYQENKEKRAAQNKVWYQENKEKRAAQHKVYNQENKEKIAAQKKVYNQENREKILAQHKVYQKKNREKLGIQKAVYLSTEKGFLFKLYSGCKGNTKKRQSKNPSKEWSLLSKEEFLEAWEEHKAKHGYNCGYYNDEPIIIQSTAPAKNGKRNPRPKNLLSVDRLDPEKGYTKKNIVFCGWDVNRRKNDTKPKDSYQFIRVYEERNQ